MSTHDKDQQVLVTSGSEGRWFGQTPAVFLLHSGAKPAPRCVMTALCLYADGASGKTEPLSQEAIAQASGVVRETANRCITWLEENGWIEVFDTGERDASGRFPERVYSVAPAWRRERERFAAEHAHLTLPRRRRKPTSDDRSQVTSDDRSPVPDLTVCSQITGPVTTDHRTSDDRSQYSEETEETDAAAAAAASVNVTVDQVLAVMAEVTGATWTAARWRPPIEAALSAHPELTVDDHRRIITAANAAPWRRPGALTPNHVFASIEQFERCIADAGAAAPGMRTARHDDGLEPWESDALQRFQNSHVDAHLDQIDREGSPAARAKAAAARTARQVVAA